jgi:ADP-heptose:LPS heptosyltransferase
MKRPRFNWEYLNLYKEIPLFIFLTLSRKRAPKSNNATLIVIVSLVGEFVAALPAVRDYIKRHPDEVVDLLVSPPLRPIAARVRGVRAVYTCRSVYKRASESVESERPMGPYAKALVLRISPECCALLRRTSIAELRTALPEYTGFALHLGGSLLQRKRPRQWREMNFAMLGSAPRPVPFEDIFDIPEAEYKPVRELAAMRTPLKKLIIHTGSNWPMKSWPNERWTEVVKKIHALSGWEIIFIGTETEDGPNLATISSALTFPVESLIGKTTLLQTLLVMRLADRFIGVDSGPANMAHVADLRSVTIFGPGPHFYLPLDPRDIALDKSRGRGALQMFFRRKRGFIHRISSDEAFEAFKKIAG